MRIPITFFVTALLTATIAAGGEEKPAAPKPEPKIGLAGLLQLDYRRGDAKDQKLLAEHELNLRRARLFFTGKVNDRIAYGMTLQGDGGQTALLDGFADLTLKPAAKLRVGQYKYEFDITGRESAQVLAFADRPWVTNAVAGSMNGASTASSPAASFRDRGVTVLGDTKTGRVSWGYGVGVMQGAGRGSDNNNAFGYTLHLHILPIEKLRLSGGFLASDSATRGAPTSNEYSAWTAGASYETSRLTLRGEYYHGQRDKGTASESVKGFYVHGIYTRSSLDLMLRYQQMQDTRFVPGSDEARSVDLGAKWYFVRQNKRGGSSLAVNYLLRDADPGFKDGVTVLNDGRGGLLTAGQSVGNVLTARLQVQF